MKITVLEPLFVAEEKWNELTADLIEAGHEIGAYTDRVEDDAVLIERAKDADILMMGNLPISADVINALPNLKMLSVAFTGVDHIAMDACKERGIVVCNAQGYATDAVAELAIGLMIAVLRNIVPCDAVTREGKTRAGLVGSLLKGKTVGIVGTGEIGIRTAEIAKVFGCKLLGYSRSKRAEAEALGIEYVTIEELMKQSDVVSLHTPLTPETTKLINAERIGLMKKNAILVNVARGAVVDSEALAAALNNGDIAGAGIDVFEMEPPLDTAHPLLHSKNTVVAPHVAFASTESFIIRAQIVLNNIRCWMKGEPQNVK